VHAAPERYRMARQIPIHFFCKRNFHVGENKIFLEIWTS
jgi:hypothetical protein